MSDKLTVKKISTTAMMFGDFWEVPITLLAEREGDNPVTLSFNVVYEKTGDNKVYKRLAMRAEGNCTECDLDNWKEELETEMDLYLESFELSDDDGKAIRAAISETLIKHELKVE